MEDRRVADAVRALLAGRDGTVCPSEVARALDPDRWRDHMEQVRTVAAGMDDVRILQRGEEVDLATARGPVRLGRRPPAR